MWQIKEKKKMSITRTFILHSNAFGTAKVLIAVLLNYQDDGSFNVLV